MTTTNNQSTVQTRMQEMEAFFATERQKDQSVLLAEDVSTAVSAEYQDILRGCLGPITAKTRRSLELLATYCQEHWNTAYKAAQNAGENARSWWLSAQWYTLRVVSTALNKRQTGNITEEDLAEFQDHGILNRAYFGAFSLYDEIQLAYGRAGTDRDRTSWVQGGRSLTRFLPGYAWIAPAEKGYMLYFADEEFLVDAFELYKLLKNPISWQRVPATLDCVMEPKPFRRKKINTDGFTFSKENVTIKTLGGDELFFQQIRIFAEYELVRWIMWGTLWGRSEAARNSTDAENYKAMFEHMARVFGEGVPFPENNAALELVRIRWWYDRLEKTAQAEYHKPNGRLWGYTPQDLQSLEVFQPVFYRLQEAFNEQQAQQRTQKPKAQSTSRPGASARKLAPEWINLHPAGEARTKNRKTVEEMEEIEEDDLP